jgi:hypothetical protein
VEAKDGTSPREACTQFLEKSKRDLTAFLAKQKDRESFRFSSFLQYSVESLGFSQVVEASRDVVAVLKQSPDDANEATLSFGFRGTLLKKDYIVDALLAVNSKRIRRLSEARKFVKSVLKRFPSIKNSNLHMYGHVSRFDF